MFPMRMTTIFKNRWMALLWAAGILFVAYQFAGAQPQDDNSAADANQAAAAENAL
jgi:hypothetical protein